MFIERFALRIMTVWGLRTMQQNIQRGQASRFLLGLSFILFRETLSHLELKITRKSESRHRIL